MPSNQTPNYALNQWERDDRVLMEDFNADNAKIDAALAAQAGVLAAHSEMLSKLSNCRVHLTSYTGNGICDLAHSPRVPLPAVPKILLVLNNYNMLLHVPETGNYSTILSQSNGCFMGVSWDGTTAVLEQYTSNRSSLMNGSGKYYVLAFYEAE